jgi:hypothetical protein
MGPKRVKAQAVHRWFLPGYAQIVLPMPQTPRQRLNCAIAMLFVALA